MHEKLLEEHLACSKMLNSHELCLLHSHCVIIITPSCSRSGLFVVHVHTLTSPDQFNLTDISLLCSLCEV